MKIHRSRTFDLRMTVAAGLLALLSSRSVGAVEPCKMRYEGSFLMPSPEASYTAYTLCLAPDETPRLGGAVTGPTLIASWDARADYGPNPGSTRRIMEFTIPTLSRTAGSLSNATYVGTAFDGDKNGPFDVDSAGNFWGPDPGTHAGRGLKSNPGVWKLGGTGAVVNAVQETGWGGTTWTGYGVLRRRDAMKAGLPSDGTQDGATFVTSDRNGLIYQNVRSGDGGPMTAAALFQPRYTNGTIGIWEDNSWQVQYIKDTTAHDWFVVFRPSQNGTPPNYRSSMFLFYRATASDGGATPSDPFFTIDIDADIREGAGYAVPSVGSGNASHIFGLAADWDTGKVYVLNPSGYANTRVHVFTAVGAPARGTVIILR